MLEREPDLPLLLDLIRKIRGLRSLCFHPFVEILLDGCSEEETYNPHCAASIVYILLPLKAIDMYLAVILMTYVTFFSPTRSVTLFLALRTQSLAYLRAHGGTK